MSPVRPTSASSPRLPPDSAVGGPFREVLSLDRLVTDAGTQIRSAIDDDVVDEYVQALADGAQFPPGTDKRRAIELAYRAWPDLSQVRIAGPDWIADLEEARRGLGRFIRRLRQEIADGSSSTPVED